MTLPTYIHPRSLLFLLLLLALPMMAQRHTVSGYITDAESGERLIGASVYDTVSHQGVATNVAGFYTLTLPEGTHALQVSYVGYHSSPARAFLLNKDTVLHFTLRSSTRLEEVTVVGHQSISSPHSAQMSAVDVPIAQIRNIPAIGGEVDVLKAIQLLPGVQSGSEGSAGIYVRGGGPDENLITLDGVPLYNVSHAMGMFSVFNADAIKNVTLYKGNFPARFGSRLSSVIDVRQNDGNSAFWHGGITVGLLAAKLNLEGPIFTKAQLDSLKRDLEPRARTTFNISARRTYFDLFMAPVIAAVSKSQDNAVSAVGTYCFYDVNAKIAHTFSDKDRLSASFYIGDDVVATKYTNSKEDENGLLEDWYKLRLSWGNIMAATNWEHQITPRLFSCTQLSYTRYLFHLRQSDNKVLTKPDNSIYTFDQSFLYSSQIHDLALQTHFDYAPAVRHDIKFGGGYTYHHFRPSVGNMSELRVADSQSLYSTDTVIGGQTINGHEAALFIEDTYSPWQWLRMNIGVRASLYGVDGKVYPSVEPRLGIRTLLYRDLAFKVSYSYMSQYVHLLSNSSVSMPTDLWVPVTKNTPPMRSMQIAAGLSYNVLHQLDISVEGYYKYSKNLLEYKDGATFMGTSTDWEDKVALGNGWSYGVEVLLQRTVGPVTGWIGYTWSRTMRLFEAINYGKPFHAKYDREHDLSVTLQYAINRIVDIAATFIYGTGTRATLATQKYYQGGHQEVEFISERNNYTMPDYHRLDLSANFHIPHKRSGDAARSRGGWLRAAEHIVNISVYNVYNHMNPYLIIPEIKEKKLYQISLFPILPSISYQFKF